MMKIKRLVLKYDEDNNDYVVIKVQNVEGFKPKEILNEKQLKELHNSDIEVIVK